MRSLKIASAVAATRCCEGSVYRAGTSVHTIVGTPSSVTTGWVPWRLVRLFPILSRSDVHDKRHLEFRHTAHQLRDLGPYAIQLRFGRLQYELVVHLHDELGREFFAVEPPPYCDHR